MSTIRAREPGLADVLEDHAAEWATARRLVGQLGACEAAALAFCRLLERWARGDAWPATAGARDAALRHAADRAETALAGLERPLDRYLLELEADRAEGRSWYGGPGAGELLEWGPVLKRAGVRASPTWRGSTRCPTARRSGPACSISARTSSARRSTCARLLRKRPRRQGRRGLLRSASQASASDLTVVGSINLDLVTR